MRGVVCLGDITTQGGHVITASSGLFFDGTQAALVGDLVSCPLHGVSTITEGSATMYEGGLAVVISGCLCGCGCQVISSRPEISIES